MIRVIIIVLGFSLAFFLFRSYVHQNMNRVSIERGVNATQGLKQKLHVPIRPNQNKKRTRK